MLGMPTQPTRPRKAIAPLVLTSWQREPWRDTSPVILLTGSAGGGKSRLAAEKVHGYMLKYPGATGLVLRKSRSSLTNSTIEMMRRVVIGADPRVRYVGTKSRCEYANGSLLLFAGLEDEEQRERLRSIGAEGGAGIAWMEEATEFDEADFPAVEARLRDKTAPWRQLIVSCNPDAPTHWIYRRLIAGGAARVYYSSAGDNPHNPADYLERLGRMTGTDGDRLARGLWVQATGLIFDTWQDGPREGDPGNVTDAAEYIAGAGELLWFIDDGYSGRLDPATGYYTAESHPRAILLAQLRGDGTIAVFAEDYAVHLLAEQHLDRVAALGYPDPDSVVVDKSAAELKGRLYARDLSVRNGANSVEESIKITRSALARDSNGRRRIIVHPRCRHLRAEMLSFRRDEQGRIIKQHDHGPDALRYGAWALRYEE